MSNVLCSRLFHLFQNIPLKYSSLNTHLQIILKRLYRKVIQQASIEGRDIFQIIATNRNRDKNVQ